MKVSEYLERKTYPGRVLICGNSNDGEPVLVYAVMGRSDKSRNRILKLDGDKLSTELYMDNGDGDNLIIYSAKGKVGNKVILGNGEHVGYIEKSIFEGKSIEEISLGIYPEPDSPNYTPRIAFVYDYVEKSYQMMIVRRIKGEVERVIWRYKAFAGFSHIIHTYIDDSNPLIPFSSDPVLIEVDKSFVDFARDAWDSLNKENRVALYYSSGDVEGVINQREVDNGKA